MHTLTLDNGKFIMHKRCQIDEDLILGAAPAYGSVDTTFSDDAADSGLMQKITSGCSMLGR